MNLKKLANKKLYPLRDLVALKWVPTKKSRFGILIPESYSSFGLKLGNMFVCEVLAIGPEVDGLKPKDQILLHEYSLKNFPGRWKEDEIYFTEFQNCQVIVSGIKGLVERIISKSEEEALEKSL